MNNSLIPVGDSRSSSIVPSPSDTFAKIMQSAPKRLEYLKAQKGLIGNTAQWLIIGGVLLFAGLHFDQINTLFDNIATLTWKAIAAVVSIGVGWTAWHILNSEWFKYDVTMMLDRMVFHLHRLAVVHNDEDAAEFSIARLGVRADEVDASRGGVNAARDDAQALANSEKKASNESFQQAQGIEREMSYRNSHNGKPMDPELADYSSQSLQSLFSLAQHTMKVHYGLFQSATGRYEMLLKQSGILKEVSEAVRNIIAENRIELDALVKSRALDKKVFNAMDKSAEALDGQDMQTFQMAVQNIRDTIDTYNGQISILMDRLNPAVQNYRLSKVGGRIADEQFYQEWIQQAGVVNAEQKEKLLSAPSVDSVIPEVEEMLGNSQKKTPEPVPVPVTRGRKQPGFDDLLGKQ